jgi:hypothetical protein
MHQTIGLIRIIASVIYINNSLKCIHLVNVCIKNINFAGYVSRGRKNTAAKAAFIKEK